MTKKKSIMHETKIIGFYSSEAITDLLTLTAVIFFLILLLQD